jgi:hypothetical protein
VSPLAERRRAAREAAFDNLDGSNIPGAIEACIDAATRVQVTDSMTALIPATRSDAYDIVCDLFAAAGFEVVE